MHGTGVILITDTATATTAPYTGTTGTTGDGVGMIRGDTAGAGMTGHFIPGDGDGDGDGTIRGTTEDTTPLTTTIITMQDLGTGLIMTMVITATTVMALTTPAGAA